MGALKTLIVDDEPIARRVLRDELEPALDVGAHGPPWPTAGQDARAAPMRYRPRTGMIFQDHIRREPVPPTPASHREEP